MQQTVRSAPTSAHPSAVRMRFCAWIPGANALDTASVSQGVSLQSILPFSILQQKIMSCS